MLDKKRASEWINRANRALDIIALRMETERNPSRLHHHKLVFDQLNMMLSQAINIYHAER